MLGQGSKPGILPCAVRDIFRSIDQEGCDGVYTISVSYLEIYNESINDLFNKDATNLKLISDEHVSTCFNQHLLLTLILPLL